MTTYPLHLPVLFRKTTVMFLRTKSRFKDGKEHRYWSIVERHRTMGNKIDQLQVLYLGEMQSKQIHCFLRTAKPRNFRVKLSRLCATLLKLGTH
jgi:hypothetical protein